MSAQLERAFGYQGDNMNLPVADGLQKELSTFETERHGDAAWNVFYVVAPDGLCFWFGERQSGAT